ncbi:MAG: hypothetical protein ACPL1G_06600 [Thermodesulfovibrionales bacterium]
MKKRNILEFIKQIKRPKDSAITYDEDVLGYEAFPSKYLEKIIKNYRYNIRFFDKKEKTSITDI